jgi:hypothetical protein
MRKQIFSYIYRKILKLVNNDNGGPLRKYRYWSRTMAIEVYLSYER